VALMGEYAEKNELVSLLKITNVTFEKTGQFTRCGT